MGKFDHLSALSGGLVPGLDMQAAGIDVRVLVMKMGGQYMELPGVKSFEKDAHDNSGDTIIFWLADSLNAAVRDLLTGAGDTYVDVKMEFSFGVAMKFSGNVEGVSKDRVSIVMATSLTPEVTEMPDSEMN